MCLGIPGRVARIEASTDPDALAFAWVEFASLQTRVCISCVPDVQIDEYVLVHAGIALNRIDAAEADRLREWLQSLDEEAEHEIPR